MKNYNKYLLSTTWLNTRNRILKLRGYKCEKCGIDKSLVVHHGSYKKVGNEPDSHLFVLCNICHQAFHDKYGVKESMLNRTHNFIYGKGWRNKQKILNRRLLRKNTKIKATEIFKITVENESKINISKINKKFKYL